MTVMEDTSFIVRQKEYLLKLRNDLLNAIKYKSTEDLHIPSDEIVEDGDQAQTYINQNVTYANGITLAILHLYNLRFCQCKNDGCCVQGVNKKY